MADANIFNGVTGAANQEIAAQCAAEAQTRTCFRDVVKIAVKVVFVPVQLGPKGKFLAEEPRFDKRQDEIFAPSPDLHVDSEFLSATAEERRIEQVEVSFPISDETDQVIH